MAITGTFAADFASFFDACTKADKHLTDMSAGADRAATRLNAMQDSFSGKKVIQDATLMVEAVNRAGGAAVLTEKEMRRVNAAVEEGIAKYTALGQAAPKSMTDLAAATAGVEKPTGGLSTSMVSLGVAIGTMAANAAMALAKLAVEGVGKLVAGLANLALTGAGMADVAENFDLLTAKAGLLGGEVLSTLREGTHKTIADFELMKTVNQGLAAGMNLTTGQMGTLARGAFALAQATGGDVKTAFDTMNDAMLTGRTRAIAMLTGKIDLEAAETKYAISIGTTRDKLTEIEKVEAARIGILDSVAAATARLGVQTDGLDEKVAQAQTSWQNFKDKLGQALATSPVLGAALESVGKSLTTAFGGSQDALVKTIVDSIMKFGTMAVQAGIYLIEFGKTGVQVFGAFSVPQKAVAAAMIYVVERFAAGIATMAELAAKLPGVGGAFEGVATSARGAATVWGEMRTEAAASLQSSMEMASGQSTVHTVLDKVKNGLINMKAAMEAATNATVQAKPPIVALVPPLDEAAAALRKAAEAKTAFLADFDKFEKAQKYLPPFTILLQNLDKTLQPLPAEFNAMAEGARFAAEVIETEVTPKIEVLRKTITGFSEAMALVSAGEGTMTGQVAMGPRDSEAKRATQAAYDAGRYWGPVIGGSPSNPRGSGVDWKAIGFLAKGGSAFAGSPYMVGERGPELFVPSSSGTVHPNGAGGGAVVINVTVKGSTLASRQELATLFREAMVDFARSQGQRVGTRV